MLRTVIIEDEPDKREILKLMLEQVCPGQVLVVGEAESVPDAVALIGKEKPDLVFLDVEIRLGTGFQVLTQLSESDNSQNNFAIIFTTAYNNYAVDAFRFDALDYLVKPIRSSLLKEAVTRAADRKKPPADVAQVLESLLAKSEDRRIPIATDETVELVATSDIVRVQGEGSYSTFFLSTGKRLVTSRNLGRVEKSLEGKGFLKVHQSHLVNKQHVTRFMRRDGGSLIMSNDEEVPVSRRLKTTVQEWLDGM